MPNIIWLLLFLFFMIILDIHIVMDFSNFDMHTFMLWLKGSMIIVFQLFVAFLMVTGTVMMFLALCYAVLMVIMSMLSAIYFSGYSLVFLGIGMTMYSMYMDDPLMFLLWWAMTLWAFWTHDK